MPFVIVGTYGQKQGHVDGKAEGVYVLRLNADGSLTPVPGADGHDTQLRHKGVESELCQKNKTYVTHHRTPEGADHMYFASEGVDTMGSVIAASFDRETGQLSFLSQSDAGGMATCYLEVAPGGRHVVAANYLGTIAAFPRNADGTLGARSDLIKFPLDNHRLLFSKFPRANPARQEDTHPHMTTFNRDGTKVLVPDLGMDVVWAVDYAAAAQADDCLSVSSLPGARNELVVGAGPRHMVLHPTLNVAYVLYEMASIVVAYPTTPDGTPGDIPLAWPTPALTEESGVFEGTKYGDDSRSGAAAIRIHPSGKFLYSTNRVFHGDKQGLVSCYAIDEETGVPELTALVPTGGEVPRDMILSADGSLCLVANQDTHTISSYSVDPDTGVLSLLHTTPPSILNPVSMVIVD